MEKQLFVIRADNCSTCVFGLIPSLIIAQTKEFFSFFGCEKSFGDSQHYTVQV